MARIECPGEKSRVWAIKNGSEKGSIGSPTVSAWRELPRGHREIHRHGGRHQKTNPPAYSKGLHPLEADDWLRTINNNLEVAAVGENEKVLYEKSPEHTSTQVKWWQLIGAL